MSLNGLLTNVRWAWDGTETTADALAGDTVLPVDDAEALSVGASVFIAEAEGYEVVGVDLDGSTVTVDPPLLADTEAASPVVPSQGGQPSQSWVAEVVLPDSEEPIEVPLVYNDLLVFPEGEYDPPKPITITDDMTAVVTLPGQFPTVSPQAVDLSGVDLGVGSDGVAPDPVGQVFPFPSIRAVMLQWAEVPNPDPQHYNVYASTATGFAPGPTNKIGEASRGQFNARQAYDPATGQLVDLAPVDSAGAPIPYYFRVAAEDTDDEGGLSAEVSASPVQVTQGDIAVEAVTADKILANSITADKFAAILAIFS